MTTTFAARGFTATEAHRPPATGNFGKLKLLVKGKARISVAIKYLTQSSWSHTTLFVSNALPCGAAGEEPRR
jgi:hypothetical protein